ncbi:MAG: hypothetical protein IJR00_04325 [Lachnospiraceae bacterium]|nr:hypothetical protein [Lachnospiraceae bacterium]
MADEKLTAAENDAVKNEAADAEVTEEQPKRRRWLKVLSVLLVLALLVFGLMCLTHRIVFFRNGTYLWLAERVALKIEKDEIRKLDYLTHLKEADLRQSECFPEIHAWAKEHPSVDVSYTVHFPSNINFDERTKTADLTRLSGKAAAVSAAKDYLYYVEAPVRATVDLSAWDAEKEALADQLDEVRAAAGKDTPLTFTGEAEASDWAVDTYLNFCERYPEINVTGSVMADGVSCALDATALDYSKAKAKKFPELTALAPSLPALEHVDFGREEDGHTRLAGVSAFYETQPELDVDYVFTAFDKKVNLHTKILDFNHIEMDDQGKEVREILTHMPKVEFLDMDFCGVDNEHMAKIRDDFPDVEVVWRVWFGAKYSVRTDATKILASRSGVGGSLAPDNTEGLKYCTKMKYLDIGHNGRMVDISFVSYMPDLEVLIIMMGNVKDISPIADCKHMEFLEIFTNDITDLTPLKDLKELKHLNICYNHNLADMTPLYNLTQLERLWIGTRTRIPREQIQKFKELAPDCEVNDWCGDPHTNWRWGTERYALLQKQLGYLSFDYQFTWADPLYKPHPETDVDMEHVEDD